MVPKFRDRPEAGELLAEKLADFANRPDVLVLALPRGGVPVAAEVARELNAPLDVFVVRKLGLPGYPELAMGAIASGGVRALNREVIESLNIPADVIDTVARNEQRELARRERGYRAEFPPLEVRGKTVIIVDDGIATGSTMMAAVAALRRSDVARIVVAVPVIAPTTYLELRTAADEIAAVFVPAEFQGVGQWYEDFSQTSDDEVREVLAQNHRARAVPTNVPHGSESHRDVS